jgi:hypothetical protein
VEYYVQEFFKNKCSVNIIAFLLLEAPYKFMYFVYGFTFILSTVRKAAKFAVNVASMRTTNSQ